MKLRLSLFGLMSIALTANAEDLQIGKINVFSPGPLPSIGISQDIVPGSIQVIKPQDVQDQSGVSLADYLNNNTQGISFNEVGGNPWQPEIFFRGYSAGSITGNPQGLSIFVDGVRENQPFSDVVLWDTIPTWALAGTQVVAGSNPIYGLNTLGGAIAMQTKNGKLFNQGRIEGTVGSWDRTAGLIEYGGIIDGTNVDYYFGYKHSSEHGWRDHTPSHLNQAFGKIGNDFENGRIELSYTGASNNLIGNGLAPRYLLGADNEGVNTVPDLTENRYHKFNLAITQFISDTAMLSANAYYRSSNRYTLNGDAEIEWDGDNLQDVNGLATDVNRGGRYIVGYSDYEIDEVEGETRTTKTKQDAYGISAQLTLADDLMGYKNHFVTGLNLETSLISFVQNEYEGSNILAGRIIDAKTGEFENNTKLQGRTNTFGLYAVDTLSINDQWHVTGGVRYNYTEVDNTDRRADQSGGSLTEKQSWGRINPTIGVTFKPNDRYSTYASYSESNRAPTSIEMGCSNPAIACSLPTQMADDPPLDDVVSKTYEVGARGNFSKELSWNAAIYHAMNHDDLMFISTNAQNGLGYFDNIGRTQRDGIDLGFGGETLFGIANTEKFSWNASYGYVNATYDSALELTSDANSSRSTSTTSYNSYDDEALIDDDNPTETLVSLAGLYNGVYTDADVSSITTATDASDGTDAAEFAEWVEDNVGIETSKINVSKGDQLANVPQHRLKFRLNYDYSSDFRLGLTALGYGKAYLMGNENQKHNGDGETSGYLIFNADAHWSPAKNWLVSLKAINLLDKDYYSGGRLLMNGFTGVGTNTRSGADAFRGPGFVPGSPQAAWITLSYQFK
ncbi:TonB-dependent receptor [Methylophilaceae bacterium]|nr:TonB-dependent receptor [Methylophilaceae bacterium]